MSRRSLAHAICFPFAPCLLVFASACGVAAAADAGALDAGTDAPVPTDDARAIPDAGVDAPLPAGWSRGPDLPHPVQEIAGTVHDGAIVIAGGIDDGVAILDEVWRFDGTTWTPLPAMPAPRHHMMLVSTPGALYAIGGMQSLAFDPLDTVWRLPDGASAWETATPMPEPRAAAVAVYVGTEILVLAGQGRGGLSPDVLRYDLGTTWTRGAAIADTREHVAGFVRAGEVWVVAGRDFEPGMSTTAVSIYDPAANAWREGPSLAEVRGGHGASMLPDGRAMVTGGEIAGDVRDTIEILDPSGASWSFGVPLPTRRHGHVSLPLGGRLWVIGGADRPLFGAVDVVESLGVP